MALEWATTTSSSSPKELAIHPNSNSSSSECSIICSKCSKEIWDKWVSFPRLWGLRQEPVYRPISSDFFSNRWGLLLSPTL